MAVPSILRIKLDLEEVSNIVSNSLIWVAVDTNALRTIQDFKNLLARRINIRDFNLFLKDCLLPNDETISIIRDEDLIKIQLKNSSSCILENSKIENCYSSDNCKSTSKNIRKRKISNLRDDSDKLQSKIDIKKNEDNIETFRDEFIKSKKKKKREKEKSENKCSETVVTPECEINVNSILSSISEGDKQDELILKSKELESVLDKCKTIDDDITFEECNQSSACDETRINKVPKKRRRHRKKKKDDFLDNVSQNMKLESNNISNNDEQSLLPKILNTYKNKHTRFDENEGKNDNFTNALLHEERTKKFPEKIEDSVSFDEEIASQIMHSTPLNEQRNNKSSQSKSLSQNYSCFENSLNTENYFNQKKPNSFAQFKNKEKQLENTVLSSFRNEDEQRNLNEVIMTEGKDYQQYPILRGPPRVGDIVAFKVLELSSSYCPEISSYKEGKVLQHNQGTDNFIIEMFTPNVTRTKGKFDLSDSETDERASSKQKTNSVNWSEMIDPRLVTSNTG